MKLSKLIEKIGECERNTPQRVATKDYEIIAISKELYELRVRKDGFWEVIRVARCDEPYKTVSRSKSNLLQLGFEDDLEDTQKDDEIPTLGDFIEVFKIAKSQFGDITLEQFIELYQEKEESKEPMEEPQKLMQEAKELLKKESVAPKDNVNNPPHYNQGKIECIEAIESATIGKSGIEAVCVANVIKYLWRYEKKGGRESVEKAMWYLQRLLRVLEEK